MKTDLVDDMSEEEVKEILKEILSVFCIGNAVSTKSVILTNIKNAYRRSRCLSIIENLLTHVQYCDDEEFELCPLSWGDSPEKYREKFQPIANLYHENRIQSCGTN